MEAPTIVIVTAASQPDINDIWEAMGMGPGTVSVPLCAIDPGATWETPATHYLMMDMGAQQADVNVWSAMAQSNDLPPLPNGTVWGENGVISAADAQAAISAGNMFVFPAYGLETAQDRLNWRNGALEGLGLQLIPDPEF